MKKRVIAGVAAVLGTALTLGGCELFSPPQNVYGPPNWSAEEATEKTDETLHSEIEPSPTPLYGPPEFFETDTTDEQEATLKTPFDPEFTTAAPLYGPPELFESLAAEKENPSG